jgi:exodeoxyribonuclease-3
MKIASFNANGLRARLPVIVRWLSAEAPDVLAIQETKVQDADFPHEALAETGYRCAYRGQKSYNGVAVLTRTEPEKVQFGFGDDEKFDAEARLISVTLKGVAVVNSYVPQGQAVDSDKFRYKLAWIDRIGRFFRERFDPEDPVVWVGDFNVAPTPIDVYDPEKLLGSVCYHPDEHRALSGVEKWGFVDVYRRHRPEDPTFTFWDYRVPNAVKRKIGWRIDHIWATRPAADRCTAAWIDVEPRTWEKPSDHTFIVAEFEMG